MTKKLFTKSRKAEMIVSEINSYMPNMNTLEEGEYAAIACLLYKISLSDDPMHVNMHDVVEEVFSEEDLDSRYVVDNVLHKLDESTYSKLLSMVSKYTSEDFELAALKTVCDSRHSRFEPTPDGISKLALKILDIQPGESVADVGCGCGNFLVNAALEENKASYHGYDTMSECCSVSKMRGNLLHTDMDITNEDIFKCANEGSLPMFDKVFSNYPWGIKTREMDEAVKFYNNIKDSVGVNPISFSSEWLFNLLLCSMLKENGKAVAIVHNAVIANERYSECRKYFVEKGLVECVISLPSNMFSYTALPSAMIVFSYGNESVRMIDATKLCERGRRLNTLSNQNILDIVDAMKQDSEYSKAVNTEKLRDNDYNLTFTRYVGEDIQFDNGVPFESVIKKISRGTQLKAKDLDEINSDTPTDYQYLTLSNIHDGYIDEKLPYLSHIDSSQEKYCILDRSLVMTKNGYPYKFAVVNVPEGKKILANTNLFVIELDEEKVDPYYIQAFLESDVGMTMLKRISVGSALFSISLEGLKKMMIPLPSLEEQKVIASDFQNKIHEIADLNARLAKAVSGLHHICDAWDDKKDA